MCYSLFGESSKELKDQEPTLHKMKNQFLKVDEEFNLTTMGFKRAETMNLLVKY
jgi:hypothetical protein